MMVCLFVGLFFMFKHKRLQALSRRKMKSGCMLRTRCRKVLRPKRNIAMQLEIEKRIMSIRAVNVVGGLAGLNILTFSNKSNVGTVFVNLKHWNDRDLKTEGVPQIMAEIQKRTADLKGSTHAGDRASRYSRSRAVVGFHL